jgi:hypothetical protein
VARDTNETSALVFNMKICFLIMAHHQPEVFHKLIDSISVANCDVVIHLDRRSDIADFARPNQSNVFFLRSRQSVHWAGWSQTKAIMKMMRFALDTSDADYFLFLAGTDFPIKSLDLLAKHLAKNYPLNFLNHYPLVPGTWGYGLCSRFHLVDLKATVFDSKYHGLENQFNFRKKMVKLVEFLEKNLNKYFSPRDIELHRPYHGSSRWCLNRSTIEYLVSYYFSKNSKALRRFLWFATSSDEIFIQTAVFNSEMKKFCLSFNETESIEIFEGKRKPLADEKKVYFHFIDWSPQREDPAILDESDFQSLKDSDKFFAVKFTGQKSLGLIEMIESQLLV